MVYDINGKVALITGGAQGIGFEYARELLRVGLKGVTIVDINEEKGEEAVSKLNGIFGTNRAMFVKTDILDGNQFEEAFKKTVEVFKHVDILINNAAIIQDAAWEKSIDINIKGPVRGILLGLENYLKNFRASEEAVIVNTLSTGGITGLWSLPIYSLTKFAGIGMVKSWGRPEHFERTGVRVMGICPGNTDTGFFRGDESTFLSSDYSTVKLGISYPKQSPNSVAVELVKIIQNGSNGSIWIVENDEPAYEYIQTPRGKNEQNK